MVPETPLELSFLHTVSPAEKRSKPIAAETPSAKPIKELPEDLRHHNKD